MKYGLIMNGNCFEGSAHIKFRYSLISYLKSMGDLDLELILL